MRMINKASEDSGSDSASSSWGSFAPQHRSATPRLQQTQNTRSSRSARPQHYTSDAQPTYLPQQPPSTMRSSLPKPLTSNVRPGDSASRYGSSTPTGGLTRESKHTSTRPQHSAYAPRIGTQKRPLSTSISALGSSSTTRQNFDHKCAPHYLVSDIFRGMNSAIPSAKPVIQTRIVITTPAGCRELPIANAILSSPTEHSFGIPRVFSTLQHVIWKTMTSMFNGFQMPTSDVSGRSNGAAVSSYSGSTGSGGGGSGGDGGDGDRRQGPGTEITCAIACALWLSALQLRTSDIRSSSAQWQYRRENNIRDRNLHAAHILSLEVLVFAVHEGILRGIITMAREKICKYLKEALNVQENFQTVTREENLGYHRKFDGAIINGDLSDEQKSSTRGKDIIAFVKEHFIRMVPLELTISVLRVFKTRGMITEATADHIEVMAREIAPKI